MEMVLQSFKNAPLAIKMVLRSFKNALLAIKMVLQSFKNALLAIKMVLQSFKNALLAIKMVRRSIKNVRRRGSSSHLPRAMRKRRPSMVADVSSGSSSSRIQELHLPDFASADHSVSIRRCCIASPWKAIVPSGVG